jgi:hypothetical protein
VARQKLNVFEETCSNIWHFTSKHLFFVWLQNKVIHENVTRELSQLAFRNLFCMPNSGFPTLCKPKKHSRAALFFSVSDPDSLN